MSWQQYDTSGEDLVRRLARPSQHPVGRECPGCGESVMRDALTVLLYAFDVCSCEFVDYEHLTERIWHRACYVAEHLGVRYRWRSWNGRAWEYRDDEPDETQAGRWIPVLHAGP